MNAMMAVADKITIFVPLKREIGVPHDYAAEIIPIEPDADNTAEGSAL